MTIPSLNRLIRIGISRIRIYLVLVTLSSLSFSVFAMTKPLERPALMSKTASSYLLLDIAKAGNNFFAVGARGHILLSKNNGLDWEQMKVPTSVLLTAVDFPSANEGWVVGHGGIILHTSNGGKTWQKQFDVNDVNKQLLSQAKDRVKKLDNSLHASNADEREEIEYKLEEANYALEDVLSDIKMGAEKAFLDVLFLNDTDGFVIGEYGLIFKTTDAGKTWRNYSDKVENLDRFNLNAIQSVDENILLITGETGVIFRSENAGDTWETIENPAQSTLNGFAKNDKVILAFGVKGELILSKNSGLSWDKVDSGTYNNLFSGSINRSGNITIVGSSGTVLYSENNGKSFSNKTREKQLTYTSLQLVDSGKMLVTGESGISIFSPSGNNISTFSERKSLLNNDFFAKINTLELTDNLLTLTFKTPQESCTSYDVLNVVDHIQWALENTAGVKSTISPVTFSKHVIKGIHEGNYSWFELPSNDSLISSSLQRSQTLINSDCSSISVLVFLEDDKTSTISNVTKAMNELARENSSDSIDIIAGEASPGFKVLNKIGDVDIWSELGGYIRIEIETIKGDIFNKQFMEVLNKITDEVFYVQGVDRVGLKSLWTSNVRWFDITEDGFQGGPVIPDEYDGSNKSLNQLKQKIIKTGYVGSLVRDDFKSTTIFVPLLNRKSFIYSSEFVNYIDVLNEIKKIMQPVSNVVSVDYDYSDFVKIDACFKADDRISYGCPINLLQSLADSGNTRAQVALWRNGDYVKHDSSERLKKDYLSLAADKGDPYAQLLLGVFFSVHDHSKAFKYTIAAARQGDASAEQIVGDMYFKGKGIKKSLVEADEWLEKSCEKNYTKACDQRFEYTTTAATLGDINAQLSLGIMYTKGQGAERNLLEAEKWLGKACQKKNQHACKKLVDLQTIDLN